MHENEQHSDGVSYSQAVPETSAAPTKRVSVSKVISLVIIVFSVVILGLMMFISTMLTGSSSFGNGDSSSAGNRMFQSFSQLGNILNPETRVTLDGEASGRTNFLLLGRDATGQGLTDTIMVASYFYEEQAFTTINLPRDLYIFDGFGSTKINAVYSNAEARNPGSGEGFLADVIADEMNLPIHYWMSVNFESVEEVVDTLGGIEVDVPNGFVDYEYPNKNFGFLRPAPTFEPGVQTMDGETALIYARSRKGTNGEGSDFARSKRQSIVIEAIVDTLRKENIVTSASKITSFYNIINKYLKTDLQVNEVVSLALELKNSNNTDSSSSFYRYILDTTDGITCPSQSLEGSYIIIYCDGTTPGNKGVSTSRQKLQSLMQNILFETQNETLFETQIAFLGNQSFDTDTAFNELTTLGFSNTLYNNNYSSQISPATLNSIENTTIYIEDAEIREAFKELLRQNNLSYNVEDVIPASKIIPQTYKTAEIIIWVESEV